MVVKWHTAALRRSTGQTGGGQGEEHLTQFEQRVAATSVGGIVAATHADSERLEGKWRVHKSY